MPWEAWYLTILQLITILSVPLTIGKERKPTTEFQGVAITIFCLVNIYVIGSLAGAW